MALFGKKQDASPKTDTQATTTPSAAPLFSVHSVLLRPRVTEKATLQNDQHTYVFEVPQSATKREVTDAVKSIYNVTPKKVTMVRMRPQAYEARMRRRKGQKSGFKKAYVHLKKGETLDVMK